MRLRQTRLECSGVPRMSLGPEDRGRGGYTRPGTAGVPPAGGAWGRTWRLCLVPHLCLILAFGWSVASVAEGPIEVPKDQAPGVQEATPPADPATAPETPEQARRRELTAAHGAEVAEAILAGTVLKAMTTEQVLLARGAPTRKEVIPPDAELWHYPGGEVAFSDGRVSYVSLAERPPPVVEAPTAPRAAPVEPPAGPSLGEGPAQVQSPPISVGDTYVYESLNPDDPQSSVSTRRTVTSTQGRVTLSALNLDNKKAKARSLYFDREWNLIGTRSPDGSGRDYAPPLRYYDFPLYPGKTWTQTTTETDIRSGATKTHRLSGTVGDWERVTVPAGSFRGIRVTLQTELFDPGTGERIQGTDISWYVPEVRRSVKSLTTGKGGSQGLIQLISYDLR